MPFWQPSIFQQHNDFSIYLSCDYVPTSYGIVCDYFASHHLMCCTNGMQYFRSLYVKPAETCYQHQIPTQMWLKYMEVSLFHIWTQYALVMIICIDIHVCIDTYARMCAYWKYSNTRSCYMYVANETCLKRKYFGIHMSKKWLMFTHKARSMHVIISKWCKTTATRLNFDISISEQALVHIKLRDFIPGITLKRWWGKAPRP